MSITTARHRWTPGPRRRGGPTIGAPPPSDDDLDPDESGTERRIARRASNLPTGRAILGGLLVAVSALAIFAAHRAASTPPTSDWVVVGRAIPAGATITAADLALAPMQLHSLTARRALSDPRDAIGRTALVGLAEGDLVLRATIAEPRSVEDRGGRRVGIAVEPSEALGGELHTGDRIDVASVPDDKSPAQIVVRGALVERVPGEGTTDQGIGDPAGDTVILQVDDEVAARALLDARARGAISLIASSTLSTGGSP